MAHRRPKVKLTKLEKIERDIRLQLRKQERAVEMQTKSAKMMKSSAQALARLHRYKRKVEAQAANDLVASEALRKHRAEEVEAKTAETQVESQAIPLAKLGETEVGKANAKSWDGAKPKRQRKPKAPIGSEARGLTLTPPQAKLTSEAREARMESMGFRKIGKKRKDPDAVAADREKQ